MADTNKTKSDKKNKKVDTSTQTSPLASQIALGTFDPNRKLTIELPSMPNTKGLGTVAGQQSSFNQFGGQFTPEQLTGLQTVGGGQQNVFTGDPLHSATTFKQLTPQQLAQQQADEEFKRIQALQSKDIAALQEPGAAPTAPAADVRVITDDKGLPAGAEVTFTLGKVGEDKRAESVVLTQDEYRVYQGFDVPGFDMKEHPELQRALDAKREQALTGTAIIGAGKELEQQRAISRTQPREILTPQTITRVPGDDVWAATFRESIFGWLTGAGAGLGTGVLAAAASAATVAAGGTALTVVGLPLAPVAGIAAFVITAATLGYAKYSANEREMTKNIRKVSRLTRTSATIVPTMMNRPGGIGRYQAMLNIARARMQINYEIDVALRGREEGTIAGDLADADGLIGELYEFRDVYLPMIEFEVNGAAANPDYHPELLQIPGITFDVEDLE